MLDYIYQTGWGAFVTMLFFQIPFAVVFLYVIWRKTTTKPVAADADTQPRSLARLEIMWITLVIALFVVVNVASIKYMPTIYSAQAEEIDEGNIKDVDVTARSWSYDISDRQYEVGQPVRFSIKSADTMHGFAIYHPDGRLLFTTMLIPGVETPTSLIYTFKDPGKYKVRCLEYCCIAHHAMQDELIVVDSDDS